MVTFGNWSEPKLALAGVLRGDWIDALPELEAPSTEALELLRWKRPILARDSWV